MMAKKIINILSEFSIPLISGIVLGLIIANTPYAEQYHNFITGAIFPNMNVFGHTVSLKFLVNDVFMVFFFGIATVEIVQAFKKGGSMYPLQKSINPLMGTVGGVLFPIIFFFCFCLLFQVGNSVYRGWGITTATDIAIAWLFARICFGAKHPIISFLLLIAVLDDAIGLIIIAVAYPNPHHPLHVEWLSLVAFGMLFCYVLRKIGVQHFVWYIFIGGTLNAIGLLKTGVHPSLALVFIVPFLPTYAKPIENSVISREEDHSTMAKFEHTVKPIVDIGLFGFGMVNTAVKFSSISTISIVIFLSLFAGKTIGIFGMCFIADKLGFLLPKNVDYKVLFLMSMIAGIGLTVAIFMSTVAYVDVDIQNSAKMGALMSLSIGFIVFGLSKFLKIKKFV